MKPSLSVKVIARDKIVIWGKEKKRFHSSIPWRDLYTSHLDIYILPLIKRLCKRCWIVFSFTLENIENYL